MVGESPTGGVSSSERVPRVRRRDEAAPLGRAWLQWGSCLETRASGAPAGPPDPKVDDRALAFLPGQRWRFQSDLQARLKVVAINVLKDAERQEHGQE